VIPEPQHAITVGLKKSRARFVAKPLVIEAVLTAVYLDDDAGAMSGEVRIIGADRRLSAEMAAGEFQLSELHPELTFGGSGIAPQFSCAERSWI
jgi:hypothetical protein